MLGAPRLGAGALDLVVVVEIDRGLLDQQRRHRLPHHRIVGMGADERAEDLLGACEQGVGVLVAAELARLAAADHLREPQIAAPASTRTSSGAVPSAASASR